MDAPLPRGAWVYVPVPEWVPASAPPPELHQLGRYLGATTNAFGELYFRVSLRQTRRVLAIRHVRAAQVVPAPVISGHTLRFADGRTAPLWCPDCLALLSGEYEDARAAWRQTYDVYVCDRCAHRFDPFTLLDRSSYRRAALSISSSAALAALVTSVQRRLHASSALVRQKDPDV